MWDKAESALMAALKASGRPWALNKGEGALRTEARICVRDAIGRDWQCGTVQVDLNLPGRRRAYIDKHSKKVTPVMLHRFMFGSLERTGILIGVRATCRSGCRRCRRSSPPLPRTQTALRAR